MTNLNSAFCIQLTPSPFFISFDANMTIQCDFVGIFQYTVHKDGLISVNRAYPDQGQILHAAQGLHLHPLASHGIDPDAAPGPAA